jgi:hypothetical protein
MQDLDDMDSIIDKRSMRNAREFWYVSGSAVDSKGRARSFLLGPYGDSQKAESVASSKKLITHTVINLPTSDLGKASQMLKARRIECRESTMADAMSRLGHKNVGGKDSI